MSSYVSPKFTEYFLKESLKYYEKEKYEAIEPYYKHLCEKEIERINKEIKKGDKWS